MPCAVHAEIHHAVGNQKAVHRIVFADVVEELAVAVEAPDGAVRRIAGQHDCPPLKPMAVTLPSSFASRQVSQQLSGAVENLDLAEFAGIHRAVARHGNRIAPACDVDHRRSSSAARHRIP